MSVSKLRKIVTPLRHVHMHQKFHNFAAIQYAAAPHIHIRLKSTANNKKQMREPQKTRVTKGFKLPFLSIQLSINRNYNYLSLFKAPLRSAATGYLLYKGIVNKINYEYFFDELQLKDSVVSRFVIMELCVWMFAAKATTQGHDGMSLRNSMVETLKNDVTKQMKKLQENHPELATLNAFFQQMGARFCDYDEASSQSDTVFAGILWKILYEQTNIHSSYVHILLKMVKNIRRYVEENLGQPTVSFIFSPNMMFVFFRWAILLILF